MKTLLTWIGKSCDEMPGEPSAMRLVVLFGSFMSLAVPAFLWIAGAYNPQAAAVAPGASAFFGTTLGALLAAKVWQKGKESEPTPASLNIP